MNEERFKKLMSAIDDDLLEQAQQKPSMKKGVALHLLAMAACLCIVIGLLWSPVEKGQNKIMLEDLQVLGYQMNLPTTAESVDYALVNLGDAYAVPMAQATFVQNGAVYVCRAQKTETPADLTQMGDTVVSDMTWRSDNMELLLSQSETTSCVSWYEPREGIQWCLQTEDDPLELINTASQIIMQLGYQMAVAPEGAEEITYAAFMVEEMTTAETTFIYDGILYSYRTAGSVRMADLSEKEIAGAVTETAKLGWCNAELVYVEGGQGKILWYDVAPGLLYSLYMESGASYEALLTMADELYTPAQGNVG
jgi:hypothetical protein